MFQLWKLVLLCGLLTGTSASVLEDLTKDLSGAVNSETSIFGKGLDALDNTLETVLGRQKDNVPALQDSDVLQLSKQKFQNAVNLVNNGISKILPVNDKDFGMNIVDARILDVKIELAPDGKNLNLRFPITANVTQSMPLIGQTINLKASLDLLNGVRIETNAQTGLPVVVQGECISDPASFQLTLLGGQSELVNRFANLLSGATSNIASFLAQKQACPFIQAITSTLNVDFIQNAISNLQQGINQQISI